MAAEDPLLEVVYYSEPVPSSLRTLAVLALVFDRVHFPGVYIAENADALATQQEIDRIAKLRLQLPQTRSSSELPELLNCMVYAINRRFVSDFCFFPGKVGHPGFLEEGTSALVREFEAAIYGPPPPNFFPMYNLGFAKGLPGDADAAVNGPSWLAYPPNAVLYAARLGLPLLNDNPLLPPLGAPERPQSDARALSSLLALEAVNLVLPPLPDLDFQQIAELRSETRGELRPFRRAMLKLSRDLNVALLSGVPTADVQREARFIVETSVLPELEALTEVLARPQRPWHRRAADAAMSIPEIVGNFATLPVPLATAKLLATLVSVLADVRDDQLAAEGAAKRSGLYYLLRVRNSGHR